MLGLGFSFINDKRIWCGPGHSFLSGDGDGPEPLAQLGEHAKSPACRKLNPAIWTLFPSAAGVLFDLLNPDGAGDEMTASNHQKNRREVFVPPGERHDFVRERFDAMSTSVILRRSLSIVRLGLNAVNIRSHDFWNSLPGNHTEQTANKYTF